MLETISLYQDLLLSARDAILDAGKMSLSYRNDRVCRTEMKSQGNYVTEADLAVNYLV